MYQIRNERKSISLTKFHTFLLNNLSVRLWSTVGTLIFQHGKYSNRVRNNKLTSVQIDKNHTQGCGMSYTISKCTQKYSPENKMTHLQHTSYWVSWHTFSAKNVIKSLSFCLVGLALKKNQPDGIKFFVSSNNGHKMPYGTRASLHQPCCKSHKVRFP